LYCLIIDRLSVDAAARLVEGEREREHFAGLSLFTVKFLYNIL